MPKHAVISFIFRSRQRYVYPLCSTIAILLLAAVQTAAAAEPADGYRGSLFKRQAVVVSDMDRALTLYRDLLGFQMDGGINRSEPSSYVYDVLDIPRSSRIRTTALNAGQRQIRTLLLVEVTGKRVAKLSGMRRTATVVNANGRFKEIIAAVEQLGLPRKAPHVLDSVDPADGRGVEQAFSDWDGNIVLLYEFPGR